jgi:hypothetical protein
MYVPTLFTLFHHHGPPTTIASGTSYQYMDVMLFLITFFIA